MQEQSSAAVIKCIDDHGDKCKRNDIHRQARKTYNYDGNYHEDKYLKHDKGDFLKGN
jgi:hypothetical protein